MLATVTVSSNRVESRTYTTLALKRADVPACGNFFGSLAGGATSLGNFLLASSILWSSGAPSCGKIFYSLLVGAASVGNFFLGMTGSGATGGTVASDVFIFSTTTASLCTTTVGTRAV